MRKSTHILIGKRLALGLLLSGTITTFADARLVDPPTGESKDSDTKTDVPTSHPPVHSASEISASTPSSETRSTASADTHSDPFDRNVHPMEKEHPASHATTSFTPEFSADTQATGDRASAAEVLAAQQAEELKRRDAEIAALKAQLEQQRLTQEHQQRKETEVKETQRQTELEAKLDSTLDEFFPRTQTAVQHPSVQLPPPPQPTEPQSPAQEPMGINGFLGMVFGQPVENALNGPGRNFEKFISTATGRRGKDAQQQALNSLFSLFR